MNKKAYSIVLSTAIGFSAIGGNISQAMDVDVESKDIETLENEAKIAVERYRDSSRYSETERDYVIRTLGKLPIDKKYDSLYKDFATSEVNRLNGISDIELEDLPDETTFNRFKDRAIEAVNRVYDENIKTKLNNEILNSDDLYLVNTALLGIENIGRSARSLQSGPVTDESALNRIKELANPFIKNGLHIEYRVIDSGEIDSRDIEITISKNESKNTVDINIGINPNVKTENAVSEYEKIGSDKSTSEYEKENAKDKAIDGIIFVEGDKEKEDFKKRIVDTAVKYYESLKLDKSATQNDLTNAYYRAKELVNRFVNDEEKEKEYKKRIELVTVAEIDVTDTKKEDTNGTNSAEKNKSTQQGSTSNSIFSKVEDLKISKKRISGRDRFETAINISKEAYNTSDHVVIVNAYNTSDALTSSSYASLKSAPILLTNVDSISSKTLNEIKRLNAKYITIVGGEHSVSDAVVESLKKNGLEVERIAGKDRYETSSKIANAVYGMNKSADTAIIVNGINNVDALSISSLATKNGLPIFMSKKDSLHNSVRSYLKVNNMKKLVIVGGENSISSNLEQKVSDISIKSERIAGKDRYETASKISKISNPDSKAFIVASGENSVDALAASSLTKTLNAPMLLIKKNELPSSVKDMVKNINTIYFVGGENTIYQDVFSQIK
ncbi:cell wall-binding repeat-containing protein [Peptostreptococcus faecalis]|uniref:cell wall-binding repeat-containing protein n=1 Tax=Peptostreptococcus faecalis TaxID=2045015 RepID=UPI000C7984C2|nr:cell wall-binding repeat-containing protein [Peptostreptococcus faecalis]